jgi:pilus assembly protein CpaC
MKNRFHLALLLFYCSFLHAANQNYHMYKGEVKIYNITEAVDRVAVGNGALLSTSITETGQLILIAENKGDTNIHIWMSNGQEHELKVYITEKDAGRLVNEIRTALIDVKNLNIRPVGNSIQLSGKVDERHKMLIDKLEKQYAFINLIQYDNFGKTFEELNLALKIIPGIKVSRIGDKIVLEGAVEEKYRNVLGLLLKAFGSDHILNLTQIPTIVKNKMIYMNVKITEFSNSDLDELGISWDAQMNGPNAFFSKGKADGISLDSLFQGTFFGIATEITSRINLLIASGDAMLIAEPRLSAHSGGKAEFLAGGELPIPMTNADGSISVEFKEFGVILKIEPIADDYGNISAHVETEVSSVDKSVTVQGVPGFKTRKTSTDVRMVDKQTLVISGLINNEISLDANQVPWLGDIPVLGNLFSSKSFRNNNTQLVIFVTPTVYDADSDINKNHLQQEKKLLDKFQSKLGLREIVD